MTCCVLWVLNDIELQCVLIVSSGGIVTVVKVVKLHRGCCGNGSEYWLSGTICRRCLSNHFKIAINLQMQGFTGKNGGREREKERERAMSMSRLSAAYSWDNPIKRAH